MVDHGETPPPPVNEPPRRRERGPTLDETVKRLEHLGGAARGEAEPSGDSRQATHESFGDPRETSYMAAVKSLAGELRPEFGVAVGSADTPEGAYEEIFAQYTRLIDDIGRRVGEAVGVAGDEGASLRESLRLEGKKLRLDFKKTMEALGEAAPDRLLTDVERAAVTALDSMPEGSTKQDAIRTYVQAYFQQKSAADNPLPNEILRLIAKDEATTEEFVSNLIVMELENEPWQIKGFYGNINLEKFLKIIRNEWNSPVDIARRDRLTTLIDANRGFHDMNYILRRNFDQFAQQSEVIQPGHLRILSQIPGVAEGIALYEELFTAERAREGYITEEAAKRIDTEVETTLGKLAKTPRKDRTPLIRGVEGGEMQLWEVYRAHVYARNTFRILMRAVEQTSLSDLPPENKKFTTIALGKVAMVFDTLKFNGLRFQPAQQAGGPELLDNTLKILKKKRRGEWDKSGKVNVRLTRIGGTDVGLMELQNIVAARGVLATWRAGEAVLAETRFIDNGEITAVTTFFTNHKEQIERLRDRERDDKTGRDSASIKRDAQVLFAPLLDGTSINLGLMASGFGIADLKVFRELVWEKAATQDPLVMAHLLTGAEVDSEVAGDLAGLQSLQDILAETSWATTAQKNALSEIRRLNDVIEGLKKRNIKERSAQELDEANRDLNRQKEIAKTLLTSEQWGKLTDKLRAAHGMRMSAEVERITRQEGETEEQFRVRLSKAPKKLDEFLTDEQALSAEERKVLNAIMTNGQKIAPDLARIKRSYAWFLDDVPFQSINWEALGQFYDREVNDLANFNKAAQALITIVNNPFGVPTEKALDTYGEAVVAAGTIINEDASQDNIQPMFEAYLEMISQTGNRQLIWSEAKHLLNKPTSRAQEIVGVKAPSVNEAGMRTILEEAVPKHVTRKGGHNLRTGDEWTNTQADLIKHFRATAWRVFGWRNLRDYGPMALLAFLIEFFRGTTSQKANA